MKQLAARGYERRRSTLDEMLAGSPYQAYTYSYPHKTAYRPFDEPLPLEQVWADEDRTALFFYLHVPFCEMRCGFCNLFTVARPADDLATRYLEVVRRQARVVRTAIGKDATFARAAIGGGTPTQLDLDALEELFDIVNVEMGVDTLSMPLAVEMSPETVTPAKMALLRERGTNRASVGVQSFVREETKAVRRPQEPEVAHAALDAMRSAGFETLNIDLIYGMPGQTAKTWKFSIEQALLHAPEEVYLYPLYRRPLTGLGNSPKQWDDQRLDLYRRGRAQLLEKGYEQVSMRMFRRTDAGGAESPVEYVCQRDGMVGLGAGARSYTDDVHYCSEYAVGRRGVMEILHDFVERDDGDLAVADYGFQLDDEERRRRYLILSILSSDGLDEHAYTQRFDASVDDDFPELEQLIERNLAHREEGRFVLTERGLARTDVIGPWLYSTRVVDRMGEFDLR